MTTYFHRSITLFLSAALLALAVPVLAAAPNWTINDDTKITFVCGGTNYVHTLDTVTQNIDGSFTGTGFYDTDPLYTWTVAGTVDGDVVTYTITYTGTQAGSQYTNTGTIALDGSILGTSSGGCQTFSSPTGTAVEIIVTPTDPVIKTECKDGGWADFNFKNQGQCVRFVETGKDSR